MPKKSYKKKFYEEYSNFFESYEDFSKKWNDTLNKEVRHYFTGKNILHRNFGSTTNFLLREKLLADRFKTKSFFKFYEEYNGTEQEKYEYAEKMTYEQRIERFLEIYGKNIYEFENGKPKTINDKFEEYLSGDINQDDMNKIIEEFKHSSDYTKDERGNDYNKHSQNNSDNFYK